MLLVPCIFLQLIYQPTNALNTIHGKCQTSTYFGTWVPCSGSLLEQRNASPTCQSKYCITLHWNDGESACFLR